MMEVGRVFFEPAREPTCVKVVPLSSHVGNVVALVEAWEWAKAYRVPPECDLDLTRPQLLEAARRHDEAKPATFRLTREKGRWGYSFAGHRFRVTCDDLYVDALIRMHHEFSVDGIAEWQARLRREVSDVYARNFPLDLYTLEMCDQVAAEVENYALVGHADERAFMELHSRKRADHRVEIEPYPFSASPLELVVHCAEFAVTDELSEPERLTNHLKEAPLPALQGRTVTLCSPH